MDMGEHYREGRDDDAVFTFVHCCSCQQYQSVFDMIEYDATIHRPLINVLDGVRIESLLLNTHTQVFYNV